MEKSSAIATHVEGEEHHEHILNNTALVAHEEEQDPDYKLGWRSFLAITALALGNCCAALTNTV